MPFLAMLSFFVISQEIAFCKRTASGQMRSSQRRSLLARGTKAVLPKLRFTRCTKHIFAISGEIFKPANTGSGNIKKGSCVGSLPLV